MSFCKDFLKGQNSPKWSCLIFLFYFIACHDSWFRCKICIFVKTLFLFILTKNTAKSYFNVEILIISPENCVLIFNHVLQFLYFFVFQLLRGDSRWKSAKTNLNFFCYNFFLRVSNQNKTPQLSSLWSHTHSDKYCLNIMCIFLDDLIINFIINSSQKLLMI